MKDRSRLESEWPDVSRRLGAYLRRRGTSTADAQDIIQCVAERALKHELPFRSQDELLFWCLTVAKHLDIDLRRAAHRRDLLDLEVCQENASGDSLEDAVVARVRLAHTIKALLAMEGRDRDLIIAGVEARGTVSGAERVARHRARKRLLEIVGPAAVAMIAISRRLFGPVTRPATAPVLAAASLGMLVLVPLPSSGPSGDVEVPPVRVPLVAHVEQTTAHPQQSPAASGLLPVRAPAKSAVRRPTATPSSVIGEPTGTVGVIGHDRRSEDTGVLCVRDLPLVTSACVGDPASSNRHSRTVGDSLETPGS